MPKYSQVFLADKGICARIAAGLEGAAFDTLVEIGPGGGALTEHLFPVYGKRMKAVEIDPVLLPALRGRFPGLEIINADFLQADLSAAAGPGRAAFIGNLPYECSTAILDRTLFYDGLEIAVFMFQKEVARRITAAPGDSDYGALSLLTAARASAELLLDVGAGSFKPVPAVDSSVLVFRPRRFFAERASEDAFRALVKKAFSHRRKTLVNSLALCGVPKAAASAAVERLGLKQTARAQELPLQAYADLAVDLALR
ncbi:MAG: ribosomal RNA small subunit methyltransferase A [Elusimicrobia bacterium GWC2_64_44]|nr:MAG: ribosomal RNA small subunit methyltransferase A [Elusimicrobia bacterium GWC2_64_44]